MDDPARAGLLANTIKMPGTAASLRPPQGEVMSVVILAIVFALTVAQLVFWESPGETFGYAASVSIMGLCASTLHTTPTTTSPSKGSR